MNQQSPIKRLFASENLGSSKENRGRSKDLIKTINYLLDKSPIKDSQSLLKSLNIREKMLASPAPSKGTFESEIQYKSDQEIIEQLKTDPIFRRKFQIWVQKFQNRKIGNPNVLSPPSSMIDDIFQGDQNSHISFQKSKSFNLAHQNELYERCNNIIVTNSIPTFII